MCQTALALSWTCFTSSSERPGAYLRMLTGIMFSNTDPEIPMPYKRPTKPALSVNEAHTTFSQFRQNVQRGLVAAEGFFYVQGDCASANCDILDFVAEF